MTNELPSWAFNHAWHGYSDDEKAKPYYVSCLCGWTSKHYKFYNQAYMKGIKHVNKENNA